MCVCVCVCVCVRVCLLKDTCMLGCGKEVWECASEFYTLNLVLPIHFRWPVIFDLKKPRVYQVHKNTQNLIKILKLYFADTVCEQSHGTL